MNVTCVSTTQRLGSGFRCCQKWGMKYAFSPPAVPHQLPNSFFVLSRKLSTTSRARVAVVGVGGYHLCSTRTRGVTTSKMQAVSSTAASLNEPEPFGSFEVRLPSAVHTELLGRALARTARQGDVICLRGDLGAGKTSFARGYIREARDDPLLDVTSPTYVLDSTYPPERHEISRGQQTGALADAVPTIHHMDLWRLQDATQRSFVDFDEVFRCMICLIEWPERLGSLLPDTRLDVCFTFGARLSDEPTARNPIVLGESDARAWGFHEELEDELEHQPGRIAKLYPQSGEWRDRVRSAIAEIEVVVSEPR